jgi:hypothetical protein
MAGRVYLLAFQYVPTRFLKSDEGTEWYQRSRETRAIRAGKACVASTTDATTSLLVSVTEAEEFR